MTKFELRRLESHDEASLLAEIRRVAALIETPHIPQAEFNRLAKASSSTIRRRFGTWEKALDRAGLRHRYSGAPVSRKFLSDGRQAFTDEQLIQELKDVAPKLGGAPVTMEIYNRHGRANAETIRRRFGSWWKALEKAGLGISNYGKRYSEGDYFENLLNVWTHYGRQPSYGEMDQPPSRIPSGAYEARWGTWRKALRAFIDRVNADLQEGREPTMPTPLDEPWPHSRTGLSRVPKTVRTHGRRRQTAEADRRAIPLGLRYEVLRRDRFRCSLCGASPASRLECDLHVDHVVPFSRGGKTIAANLRTLCSDCDLGKGGRLE
ncbi:MAG: HNH endonuclease [Candidatus Rokubacteria bacterium]|nr:HNH endonuclease [Candidatus Rokubacteria bacterium]